MKILKFTLPGPPSASKNSRKLYVTKAGKPMSQPSDRAVASKAAIQAAAYQKLAQAGVTPGETMFGPDDDIGVEMTYSAETNEFTVEVISLGPVRKGKNGRGRDIDNMASTVLDALQGIAYKNDSQVGMLQVERTYE